MKFDVGDTVVISADHANSSPLMKGEIVKIEMVFPTKDGQLGYYDVRDKAGRTWSVDEEFVHPNNSFSTEPLKSVQSKLDFINRYTE